MDIHVKFKSSTTHCTIDVIKVTFLRFIKMFRKLDAVIKTVMFAAEK